MLLCWRRPGAAEEEEEELPEFDFEKDRPWQHPAPRAGMRAQDWKDKSVALLNLKVEQSSDLMDTSCDSQSQGSKGSQRSHGSGQRAGD